MGRRAGPQGRRCLGEPVRRRRHAREPLVRHIVGTETGIVQGREQLRAFVTKVFERTPDARRRHRRGFFTDGTVLMWEYPRETPEGEQMDFVEAMELKDGLIQHHRVYWGWFGGKIPEEDRYRR